MQFPNILTFLTTLLFTSTALAGTSARRSFRHDVASSDVNSHTNKGGNNGQANGNKGLVKGSYHVVQTTEACGNAQLNCCNTVEQSDQEGKGAIGAALGVAGFIAVGCAPVHLIAGQGLDKACSKNAVCCTGPSKSTAFGLVNVACTPIDVNVLRR